jgi:hypothetical protein
MAVTDSSCLSKFKMKFGAYTIVPPLIRPLPSKAIPLIRPAFRFTEMVKYN